MLLASIQCAQRSIQLRMFAESNLELSQKLFDKEFKSFRNKTNYLQIWTCAKRFLQLWKARDKDYKDGNKTTFRNCHQKETNLNDERKKHFTTHLTFGNK